MKIHSSKLQRIFKYLSPSIGGQTTLPQYNSFLFETTPDDLHVRIYNGTIESIVNMKGEFEPIKFAVDEFIYQIVNQLNGEITFELDGTTLIVTCGAKRYEFATIDCENWISIIEKPKTENEIDDLHEFVTIFNRARHSVALDDSRPVYTGYHIKNYHLMTTDGYRAITIPCDYEDVSLPQKEFDSILRCLDGTVYYNFDDGIHFRCIADEYEISYYTVKLEGEATDITKMVEEKEKQETILTIEINKLQDKLKDILVMQKQATKIGVSKFFLSILLESNKLYFDTTIQGLANSRQEIACKSIEGVDKFEIGFNPSYVADYAKIAQGVVTMKFTDDEMEPVLLYDESKAKTLLMPIRIND